MLAGDQLGGEGGRLPFGKPDDRLVEALNQLGRTDLVRQALGPAVRNVLAGDRGRQVDGDEVAGLRGPLDALERSEPRPQGLQFGVDLLVGHLDGFDRDRDGAQVGQVDVGPDVDLGGEDQFFAVLEPGDLDVGLAERLEFGGGESLAVPGGQRLVDDLLQHRSAAHACLQQLGGSLARAEAGDAHLLGDALDRLLLLRRDTSGRHRDAEAPLRAPPPT